MDAERIDVDRESLAEMIEQAAVKAAAHFITSQGQGGPVMRKAWSYQRKEQIESMGADRAPWWVGWREPGGRKRGKSVGLPGKQGWRLAEREADRIHAELVTGTYGTHPKMTWAEFRKDFESKILAAKAQSTRLVTARAFRNFERLARPGRLADISTKTIDTFTALRRVEKQAQHAAEKAEQISARTVNVDLRAVQTALNVAREWGLLKEVPKFRFLPEPEPLPVYVTPDDFDRLYEACDVARHPVVPNIPPPEWWRAFLAVAYMTGLRGGELLSLRRDKIDLAAGVAVFWNAKCNREDVLPLHPAVVTALSGLAHFGEFCFPWPHHKNTYWRQFDKIQAAAGLGKKYSPHALRRAFATMNAQRVGAPKCLQTLMRHKDGRTVNQYYLNQFEGIGEAVSRLFVPKTLRTGTG